jgi:hypothetical protein
MTLGAVPGCVQDVDQVSFVTNVVNPLQGWFNLPAGKQVSYTPPQGVGISGNFAFGTPPLNCPPPAFPSGVNVAEFMLNNSFQGPGAQETIDISAVAGVNAFIQFTLSGGGAWNAGSTQPSVTSFANKAIGENTGLVGVFPYACDNCTASVAPPICTTPPAGAPNPPQPQAQPLCNVQRDASTAGGTVAVVFAGFVGA